MISARANSNESGFILVLVLIVTALLVAIAANLVRETYVGAAIVRGRTESMQAYQIASSGVSGGIELLKASLLSDHNSLNDLWAAGISQQQDGMTLHLNIEDLDGMIDVNRLVNENGSENDALAPVLRRLLSIQSLPPALFPALADWTDGDDVARPDGAESDFYRSSGKRYPAANRAVYSLDELSLIRGFDRAVMAKLSPFVWAGMPTGSGMININTAPAPVLMALDTALSSELAQRIVDFRKATPFVATGDLGRVVGMENLAVALQGRICVKGYHYRIVSKGVVGRAVSSVEAIVDFSDGTGRIVSWKAD